MTQTILQRKLVRDQIHTCEECPLSQGCNLPVPFYGPSPSKIAVVGEAPGKYEDIQNRPFVGPAGQLARSWLDRVGIPPDDVAWLNVVCCYPNRTPTQREIAACRRNLNGQLAVIQPEFLLVLGGVAASAWHPGIRIGDIRGRWWEHDEFLALATYHPAAVLRNRNLFSIAFEDVTYFSMVANGEIGCVLSDKCIMCGEEYQVVENGIAWCQKHHDQKHGKVKGRTKVKKTRKPKDQRLIEIVEE